MKHDFSIVDWLDLVGPEKQSVVESAQTDGAFDLIAGGTERAPLLVQADLADEADLVSRRLRLGQPIASYERVSCEAPRSFPGHSGSRLAAGVRAGLGVDAQSTGACPLLEQNSIAAQMEHAVVRRQILGGSEEGPPAESVERDGVADLDAWRKQHGRPAT